MGLEQDEPQGNGKYILRESDGVSGSYSLGMGGLGGGGGGVPDHRKALSATQSSTGARC